jgi:hypothetical protein
LYDIAQQGPDMTAPITRRHFVTLTAGAAAALGVESALAQATPAGSPVTMTAAAGGIGMTRADWEALAGSGEPAGDFLVYTSPIDGATPVTVGYTDDIVTFVEYDFTVAGDTGIARGDAEAMIAASLPTDSAVHGQYLIPAMGGAGDTYQATSFTSESLSTTLPDATGVMAIQTTLNTGVNPDPTQYTMVTAATITTTSAPDVDLPVTGSPGGIALGRDDWIAAYGNPPEPDYEVEAYPGVGPQGMDVTVRYLPQDDVIRDIDANGDNLDMLASTQIAALEFCGGSVPADAELVQHWYFPPTEAGPLALRAFTLNSVTVQHLLHGDGAVLVLLHERPDDPKPMVPRLSLVTSDT